MSMVIDDVVGRETRYLLQTYRRQPVTFVRGEGVRLFDSDGPLAHATHDHFLGRLRGLIRALVHISVYRTTGAAK